MENTGRYLVNIKIEDTVRENNFFRVLLKIDTHPLTVVNNTAYAIKSKLTVDKIYQQLSDMLLQEDTLFIIEIKRPYKSNLLNFDHWINFGD